MFLVNHIWDFIIGLSVIFLIIGRFYQISGWNYRIPMGRSDFFKIYIMTYLGILLAIFLTYRLKISVYDSSKLLYAFIVCVIGAICVSQFFLCGMRRVADLKWCSPLVYPVVFIIGLILSTLDQCYLLFLIIRLGMTTTTILTTFAILPHKKS